MTQQRNNLKICSLLPSGTEILFALGLGGRVVGVSDLCDYPPAARDKKIVSRSKVDASVLTSDQVEKEMRRLLEAGEELYELDRDWLNSNPVDVVLTQDLCYFCEVDASQVIEAVQGMPREPRVEVLQPRTLREILSSIEQVGEACGAVESAGRLVKELEDRIGAVVQAVTRAAAKPRVFSVEGVNPLVIGIQWPPMTIGLIPSRENTRGRCSFPSKRWVTACTRSRRRFTKLIASPCAPQESPI